MAVKTAYTKRGDTEIVMLVNMELTGATAKSFVRDSSGVDQELSCSITDEATGEVTILTGSLDTGKYKLEVQITSAGKVATFPDSGYVPLAVVEDLGD